MNRQVGLAFVWWVLAVLLVPPGAQGQTGPLRATASVPLAAGGCDAAYLEAYRLLLQRHGGEFVERLTADWSRVAGGREETGHEERTDVLSAGLFAMRSVSLRTTEDECVAEIAITEDELAKAQQLGIEVSENRRAQRVVIDELRKLQDEVRRATDGPPHRMPAWPGVLGVVGSGAALTWTLVQDQQLKNAIAARRPFVDIDVIVKRRNEWRRAAIVTGGFSLAYFLVRGIVGTRRAAWSMAASRGKMLELRIESAGAGVSLAGNMAWR